jgi:hypothetical protein
MLRVVTRYGPKLTVHFVDFHFIPHDHQFKGGYRCKGSRLTDGNTRVSSIPLLCNLRFARMYWPAFAQALHSRRLPHRRSPCPLN